MAPKSRCAPPQGRRRGSGGESWVYSKGTAVLVGMVCVIVTIHLPRRVPAMIHGSWIPDGAFGA
jgi:hypothetical protein